MHKSWGQVIWGTIFCAAVRRYWWVLSVELSSCHITGVWKIRVPSRFLETLCIIEWHYSKFSLCYFPCILCNLIFNILTSWMVQDFCCEIYICIYMEIYHIRYMFYLVVNTDISVFWKRYDWFTFHFLLDFDQKLKISSCSHCVFHLQ